MLLRRVSDQGSTTHPLHVSWEVVVAKYFNSVLPQRNRRSAYKLIEIDKKTNGSLFKGASTIIDLGAAPG
jgi:23S rRNA U2552 (ribose-2'-O)-methylase RlmE/FtsJ